MADLSPIQSDLRRFSSEQLIAELARRQGSTPRTDPKHWCHDCGNFAPWSAQQREGSMPENFNACAKGHAMRFIAPEDLSSEYGFYMPRCRDRLAAASTNSAAFLVDNERM